MTLTVSMKAAAIGTTNEGVGLVPACCGCPPVGRTSGALVTGVAEPAGGVWYSEGAFPEELEARLLREGVRGICMVW